MFAYVKLLQEQKAENFQAQLTGLRTSEKNRKAQIIRLKDEVSRAELKVANTPEPVDIDALKAEKVCSVEMTRAGTNKLYFKGTI